MRLTMGSMHPGLTQMMSLVKPTSCKDKEIDRRIREGEVAITVLRSSFTDFTCNKEVMKELAEVAVVKT